MLLTLLALSTSVFAQVRGEYLITNHGAKGDGSFDNAPIINNLINGLPASGGSIVIPHGDFRLNSAIIVTKNYLTIRGLGRGSKLLVGTGVHEGIVVPVGTPRLSGLTVRDLHIAGTDFPAAQHGILVDRANDGLHISNVACSNLTKGIFLRDTDAGRITGCWVAQCESALHMIGGLNTLVSRNQFGGYSGGITVEFAALNRLQFSGNLIMPDGYTCLWLRGCDNCNVTGNVIETWYTGAIEIEGNMNSITANNLSAVWVGGNWLPDPRGRDGLYGLVRIAGNDTACATNTIMSWQPVNDIRINVLSGDRTTLRDLTIAANASNKKINIHPSTNAARITHCGHASETQLNGNSSARVTYDP